MEDQSRAAMRVSWVSILANVLLSLLKLLCGLLAHSGAMVSDAVHSCSDVFSTVVVMIGMRLSARDSDREHPYGHERLECVAAVILAVVLLITGLFIGYGGLQTIVRGQSGELTVPGLAALVAALVSIAVKEGMFWYTRRYARALDSPALMADAWHHRSDAFSSVGALVGIAGARLGLPILDPLASVVICAFIVKAALDIFRDAMDKMVDHSCDTETEAAIRTCILAHPDVRTLDSLLTRTFGNRIYIELEIAVDGRLSLVRAHEIAEQLHDDVEAAFPKVKHVMIHVNPSL
ncbi:MAG: cation diffusion facilitator family transporter [Oscillospiraceae bacterium]|nr:cation diffusion facilitator family transporter [Oscillospiraceae bacterium]